MRVPEHLLKKDPAVVQKEGLEKYGEATEIIKDKLYLGSCFNARDKEFLISCNISHILNVAEEIEMKEQEGVLSQKLIIFDSPKKDSNPDCFLGQFQSVVEAIQNIIDSNGVCLIHCMHGRSRSAGGVIAYLMETEKISYSDALAKIQQMRPLVKPNMYINKYLSQLNSLRFE